jgi:hypothetical protein
MNFHRVRTLLAATLCCAVASCSLLHMPQWAKRKPIPKAAPIRFPKGTADGKRTQIGTVLLVNAESGFVVIDAHGWALPESGMALKCLHDGADSGTLIVGGERQGSHVVADIVTGTPKKGDPVFQ